jgi:hypothetical protein
VTVRARVPVLGVRRERNEATRRGGGGATAEAAAATTSGMGLRGGRAGYPLPKSSGDNRHGVRLNATNSVPFAFTPSPCAYVFSALYIKLCI